MGSIKISVIICTYNRHEYLEKLLNSLISQDFPPHEFEIIVVDNNSTDNTKQAIDEVKKGSPVKINYVLEKRQGLSHARNRGIREASGRIVAFIDDDAVAEKNWLKEIVTTFEDVNPVPGCVGGKVLPVWEASRPEWLSESLLTHLSILDLGESPRWIEENEFVCGTNMAFLNQSVEDAGFFETRLGRRGKSLISNEEALLFHKLRMVGGKIYYQPRVIVNHVIPKERIKKRWFFKRAFAQGISDYIFNILKPQATSRKYNNINYFSIFIKIVKAFVNIAFGGTQKRYKALVYLITISGYVYGILYDKLSSSKNY